MAANWERRHTIGLAILASGVVAVGVFSIYGKSGTDDHWGVWSLLFLVGILVGLLVVIGDGLARRYDGAFIDGRFRISLAQFQLVVWTVLVLATWGAAVFTNIGIEADDPFDVSIPTELWLALGISATSFGSAKLIQARDLDNPPPAPPADPQNPGIIVTPEVATMITARGDDPTAWATRGRLLVRRSPSDARWSDLFASDDANSGGVPDVAKVQMFFFTIVLAFGYGVACADLVSTPEATGITGLPVVSEAFAILLGISQGSYLIKKGVDLRAG